MSETKILDVRYIGRTKERRIGQERSALGWHQGEWSVILPEQVLRDWFMDNDPSSAQTFYGVLSIKTDSSPDEIKSAYRRLALQWHPDRCREAGAHEIFLRIQQAYEILSNENKRLKYDAGLFFEQSVGKSRLAEAISKTEQMIGYRSPLRCGMIMASGTVSKKWFVVDEILAWQDIYDDAGRVLSASWVYGDTSPTEAWV